MTPRLLLASASPRRRELLTQAGFSFDVRVSSIPEDVKPGEDPVAYTTRLAREKAQVVFDLEKASVPDSTDSLVVLGADTTVVVEGEILGKPEDSADAARILRRLSGRTHHVITGVSLVSDVATETAAEITGVTFVTLSEAEIEAYIASGEPMDKAGAYGIQGQAARWIPRIQGCYFNVVGLPLALVANMFEGMKKRLPR